MPLTPEDINLLTTNTGRTVVGLIHKQTNAIVLAPCIKPRVWLRLNDQGKAVSGHLMDNEREDNLTDDQLIACNNLLEQGYVPRIASDLLLRNDKKSSHELLFEKKAFLTEKSEWGGFALTLEHNNKLKCVFVSGAFNTPPGKKRKTGSELSDQLKNNLLNQISELGFELEYEGMITAEEALFASQNADGLSTPPPKSKSRPSIMETIGSYSDIAQNLRFFLPLGEENNNLSANMACDKMNDNSVVNSI